MSHFVTNKFGRRIRSLSLSISSQQQTNMTSTTLSQSQHQHQHHYTSNISSIPPLKFLLCLLLCTILLTSLTISFLPRCNSTSCFVSPVAIRHSDTTTLSNLLSKLTELDKTFSVLSDKVVYNRYARVYDRVIKFPNSKTYAFDVWGRVWKNNSFSVVAVVPFDRNTQTFTLVREYNPAHAKHVYSFPQGMVEWSKHSTLRDAAAKELEEEAHLKCHDWINLLDDNNVGIPQDKYQRESVFVYLCTDAREIIHAAHVDEEEEIEIEHGVTIEQVVGLCRTGALQSNNIAAGLLAVEKLRQLSLIPALSASSSLQT